MSRSLNQTLAPFVPFNSNKQKMYFLSSVHSVVVVVIIYTLIYLIESTQPKLMNVKQKHMKEIRRNDVVYKSIE